MERVTYVARVELEPSEYLGYSVSFPDIPNCVTGGATIKEAKSRARDTLKNYVRLSLSHNEVLPKPRYRMRNDLKRIRQFRVTVDISDILVKPRLEFV